MKWWMSLALIAVVFAFFFPTFVIGEPRYVFWFTPGEVLMWFSLAAAFLAATVINMRKPAMTSWEPFRKVFFAAVLIWLFAWMGQELAVRFGFYPLVGRSFLLTGLFCAVPPAVLGDLKANFAS